jgi:ribosomal protein S18 acetylase RimI-like enzyme
VDARPYLDADLNAITGAIATWVDEAGRCGYCHPGDLEHRIYREGESVRPAFVWEDADGVAGIEISERFGHVFDLFVRPELRGTDTEVEMVRSAASRGDETDVFACDATRIDALHRVGFEQHRLWDHIRLRSLDDIPQVELPQGFAVSDDGVAARATIWFDHVNKVGLFEPVETLKGFRRRGLGRAVMTEGLHRMRAAGMRTALVEHEITNEPAAALYASLGFTVAFETLGFRRSAHASRAIQG